MSDWEFTDNFYRVSAKALIVKDGALFLVKDAPTLSGQWELPGGGIDWGETPQGTLVRELKEEAELVVTHIVDRPLYVWQSSQPYKGRMSRTCILAFATEVTSYDATLTEECDDFGFFSHDELQTLDLYAQSLPIRKHFNPADFA